jgi:cytoskeletal protein RodZ
MMQTRFWNQNKPTPYHPEQDRAAKLAELGAALRESRLTQSLSLEDVAARTLIPVRLLHAIEAGKLEKLPEPVYIQGFIRRFADALGLDGAEFARAFPTGIGSNPAKASWGDLSAGQIRPIHLYLLYIAVIVLAVKGLSARLESVPTTQNFDLQTPKTVLKSSANQQPKPTSNSKPEKSQPTTVQVKMTITHQSWVRVVQDGETAFEGILSEGTQKTWQAKKQLNIRAGNAGGVVLTPANEKAKPMGDLGAVEEVTLSANSSATPTPTPQ